MDPHAFLTRQSATSHVRTPTTGLVRENGFPVAQHTEVGCISDSDEETSGVGSKQARRKEQKRLSARRMRAKVKQDLDNLLSRNKELKTESERLANDILKLEATERFYKCIIGTIREMKAITIKQPQPQTPPPPSSPSPSPPPPPSAERPSMGAAVATSLMSSSSTSDLNDPVVVLPKPDLTQKTVLKTAAAQKEMDSAHGDVLEVCEAGSRWNRIACEAELRGPIPIRIPLAPQPQSLKGETVPAPRPVPCVSTEDLRIMNYDNDEDLIDFLAAIAQSSHKFSLDNSPQQIMLLDEQRGPLPATGSPEPAPKSWPPSTELDLQGQVFDVTLADVLSCTTNYPEVWSCSAMTFE